MPSGSRQPIIFVEVSATSEKAPSTWRTASMKRELMSRFFAEGDQVKACVSVSEVEGKIEPRFCSARCTRHGVGEVAVVGDGEDRPRKALANSG